MGFIDYKLKQRVLLNHNDLIQKQKKCSQYEYSKSLFNNEGILSYALKHKDKYIDLEDLLKHCIDNNLKEEYFECMKINHAEYERTRRLKERVRAMLSNGACVFLTLTFTDDTLAKTDEKQRRVAVVRFLKKYDCMYIANIDFGSRNHREHYHALINCDCIRPRDWKLGALNLERVRLKDLETDMTKLSKYVAKLSNHAIKETARRGALIYSR